MTGGARSPRWLAVYGASIAAIHAAAPGDMTLNPQRRRLFMERAMDEAEAIADLEESVYAERVAKELKSNDQG